MSRFNVAVAVTMLLVMCAGCATKGVRGRHRDSGHSEAGGSSHKGLGAHGGHGGHSGRGEDHAGHGHSGFGPESDSGAPHAHGGMPQYPSVDPKTSLVVNLAMIAGAIASAGAGQLPPGLIDNLELVGYAQGALFALAKVLKSIEDQNVQAAATLVTLHALSKGRSVMGRFGEDYDIVVVFVEDCAKLELSVYAAGTMQRIIEPQLHRVSVLNHMLLAHRRQGQAKVRTGGGVK